jgi:outer membrane protein, multidrug efflux system
LGLLHVIVHQVILCKPISKSLLVWGPFLPIPVSASDWIDGRSRFWSIGPRITWPVFDAGRIRANIEIRNAQQEQALTQFEKSVLTALGDVETALVNYANEQVRYRSLTDPVAANNGRSQWRMNFMWGDSMIFCVLDTQRSLYVTESALTQSQTTMATNLVALYKALGGGWESP